MRKKIKNKKVCLPVRRGLTLIETIVAIFLFGLGMVGFTLLFQKSWKINAFVIEQGTATASASHAIDMIAKELRKIRQADNGGYPIKQLSENSITVYLDENKDGKTEQVHYFLENGQLKKGVSKPSGNPVTYPSGDEEITVLANHITNTAGDPIFLYYNNSYPADAINNPLSNPKASDVRLVQIHLWINIKPLTAPENVNLQSFVELRNLNEID